MERRPWLRWLAFCGYVGLVTYLSLIPGGQAERLVWFPFEDKVAHFCMYAGMALVAYWVLPKSFWKMHWIGIACTAAAYGFLMELAQLAIPSLGRDFSWFDALSNTLGALCCAFILKFFRAERFAED